MTAAPRVEIHLVLGGTFRLALRQGVGSHEFAVAIGNLVAFAPLGILVSVLARKRSLLLVFTVAFLLSTAIELGQLSVSAAVGFGYRTADVDDVVVNVFGALIGYAAYLLFVALRTQVEPGRKSRSRRS